MFHKVSVRIEGVVPLLMHNIQLADPLNQFTKAIREITNKSSKKRTDADLEEMARLEFMGGLYLNDSRVPAIPGENIEGLIRDGAKRQRKGQDVLRGVISDGVWPLSYDGPKDPDKLWENGNFRDYRACGLNGKSKVMRMRPRFNAWSLDFDVAYQPEIINKRDLEKFIVEGGMFCGLCDYKPRYGRFQVVQFSDS